MPYKAGIATEQIVTEDEYRRFRELIEERFGMKLKGGRRLTFHMKVSHRLAILGLETYQQYYDYLLSDTEGLEPAILLSHLANHETCFFRDREQIKLLTSLLNEAAAGQQPGQKKSIRILSAASGTGEEAYTLSSVIQSCGFCPPEWDVKIIGIDVDPAAIARAKAGRYNRNSFSDKVSGSTFMPEDFIAEGDHYIVKPILRKNVEFRAANLVDSGSFAGLGLMDIILCRHVLENMTESGIQRAVRNLSGILSDEGYLFIGTSESIIQHTSLFVPQYVGGLTVYRKNVRSRQGQTGLRARRFLQQEAK